MDRDSDPHRIEYWSAILCAVLAAVFWTGPYALRVDLFNDDAAQHIFWLYQYADSELFPNDLSIAYFQTSAPWGYRALYAVVAPLMDVFLAAELLSVLLIGVSLLLAWRIGGLQSESGRPLHALLAVIALVVLLRWSRQEDLLPPIALQRSFALPLLLLTLWGLMSRKYAWVGASWIAAALFYPVVLPVQGLTAATVFLRDLVRDRRMPNRWVFNGTCGVAALAIATLGTPIPPDLGPAFTYEQAMRMPEFGPDGRLALYQDSLVGNWLLDHRTGLGWSPYVLLAIVIAVVLAWVTGRFQRIHIAAWIMLLVGVGLWFAMRLFPEQLMFGLYLPNRHSRWAVGIFGVVAIAAGAGAVIEYLLKRFAARTARPKVTPRVWVAVAAPLVVTAVLLPWAMTVWSRPVDADLESTYAFIASLPKSTLVAAHPDLADFVPLRSRRSVLVCTESSQAWMENYYKQMKVRVEASLRAAYASSIEEVDAALEPFGVDVVLTGPSVWEKKGYFAPFDELAESLLERGARQGFVLKDPPADRILFRSGEYYVVRVGQCAAGDCP